MRHDVDDDYDDGVLNGDHLIKNEIDTKIKISYGQTSIDLILTPRVMSTICIVAMVTIIAIVGINNLIMIINMMMTCIIRRIIHIPMCSAEIICS
jgi:hypothetical protein